MNVCECERGRERGYEISFSKPKNASCDAIDDLNFI